MRMGVHTGPVYRLADINFNSNVAGGGINIAQRVMNCGDAGHILVSAAVADVLREVGNWNSSLHDLGEVEVKHGKRIRIAKSLRPGFRQPKPSEGDANIQFDGQRRNGAGSGDGSGNGSPCASSRSGEQRAKAGRSCTFV